ncbi:unnamed protein product [Dovyalis caffra]|uniref:NPR1/NIM1-like C-terminal domain-containing protein n=1 Tax=Dovyalis caffra TaxID=77055 RepID=A0AAV1RL49_9ROSI|nr:unnamed protein product [Dovyalis caffra]
MEMRRGGRSQSRHREKDRAKENDEENIGCSIDYTRLMRRCEIKCGIRCNPDSEVEDHTVLVVFLYVFELSAYITSHAMVDDLHMKLLYLENREQGQEANEDRLCIDILEREMRRNPMAGSASITSHSMVDDLHMKLLYLENRMAFARVFFPTEAKLAMDIAHAATTSEFAGLAAPKDSSGHLREVDLNETPIVQNKRLRSRINENRYLEALNSFVSGTNIRTFEMGLPNCSEVLDKFMEDDLPDLFYLEKGTPDEQRIKRTRFMELKEDVQKASNKDKAEINHSGLSSLSSSTSLKESIGKKLRKL